MHQISLFNNVYLNTLTRTQTFKNKSAKVMWHTAILRFRLYNEKIYQMSYLYIFNQPWHPCTKDVTVWL